MVTLQSNLAALTTLVNDLKTATYGTNELAGFINTNSLYQQLLNSNGVQEATYTRQLMHHIMVLCQDPIIEFNYKLSGIGAQFAGNYADGNVRSLPGGAPGGTWFLQWCEVTGYTYNTSQFGMSGIYSVTQDDFTSTVYRKNQVANTMTQCVIDVTGLYNKINNAAGILDQFFNR